ncbi:MAG: hypothetical protein IJH90_02495 [Mogibacterium sp.]|nr:hypothetical protein [Mogibacterium sp.]
MERKTIIEFLNEQARSGGHLSFHMPGHKGRASIYERTGYGDFISNIMACDITEIPGADALFCPQTTLRAVMDNYAELYGVRCSDLLVNGSSTGVMSAILSSVSVGGKLILGRNSHHSAFSALRLGGINPIYLRPETDRTTGLAMGISPSELERACEANPDAEAVLITSPNYYGMLSDIAQLAIVAHEYDMILIVDQAHGAHLKFFDNEAVQLQAEGAYIRHPKHAAESLGADIVINSTHKTLLSFTGSGILNICTDRVDAGRVGEYLRMLQTTSPSYLLMGSLDVNERIMRKYWPDIVKRWREDITTFYRRASRINGLTLIGAGPASGQQSPQASGISQQSSQTPEIGQEVPFGMYQRRVGLDMTKINISMASLGISGAQLDLELRQHGIISEMVHGEFVMLMTGVGNLSSDYDRLLEVLRKISDSYGFVGRQPDDDDAGRRRPLSSGTFVLETSEMPLEFEDIPLYQADGRVLYDPVIIYPPGSPVACPGEVLTVEVIGHIADALERGEKVTGVDEEGMIRVGRYY